MKKLFLVGLLFLIISIYFLGCDKNPASIDDSNAPPQPALVGAFIVNEGNFQKGNASLSFYNAEKKQVFNNIFKAVNNTDLGDVANSMVIEDTLGYIVVNNSNKIEVISINTFKRIRTINLPAGSSPRNLVIVDGNKACVTNLFRNSIFVINLADGSILNEIAVGANPEGITYENGKVFVANSGFGAGNTISVVDLAQNKEVQTIEVGDNPQWVEIDRSDNLIVLSAGSYGSDYNSPDDDTPGGLWKVNVKNMTLIDSLILEKGKHPSELTVSSESNKGFFIYDGGIVRFDTDALSVTKSALVTGFFYHVRYNDVSDRLFVLDAKNFVDPGELIIYDMDGKEQERYTVGIIPGFVAFYNQ